MIHLPMIEDDIAGLDRLRHGVRLAQIMREDVGGQAEGQTVR
jgi:hypothetical protein